jgi:hypothetical protein
LLFFSPFVVREREGKRREENNSANVRTSFAALFAWGTNAAFSSNSPSKNTASSVLGKNPSVAGTSSTTSTTSQTSDSDDDLDNISGSSDENEKSVMAEIAEEDIFLDPKISICKNLSFETLFPGTEVQFGFKIKVNIEVNTNREDFHKTRSKCQYYSSGTAGIYLVRRRQKICTDISWRSVRSCRLEL